MPDRYGPAFPIGSDGRTAVVCHSCGVLIDADLTRAHDRHHDALRPHTGD